MGRPKATLTLGGRTLLEIVATTLSQVVSPIVVAAAADQEICLSSSGLDVIVVRDQEPYAGPLAALARALESLPPGVDAAYATGCDGPLLSPEWVRAVVGSLGSAEAAWVEIEGRPQPLASAYRRSAAQAARRLLAEGERRAWKLRERLASVNVDPDLLTAVDPEFDSLRNVNTPEDLEEIVRRWDGRNGPGCRR
jgi:molybdopterin-guanine dinucleotide biosynthesis protein A